MHVFIFMIRCLSCFLIMGGNRMTQVVNVVGAGLAGSEAA